MSGEKERRVWRLRVSDILDCILKIQEYTSGMTLAQFETDTKTVDAVIRNFEIIGEAAGHIPENIQAVYPDIAWLEMRGMRNIMIHEYSGVSLPIIWYTITHNMDSLAANMRRILDDTKE